MALVWTEQLSVGYGLIDAQHRELFQRYNSLIEACTEGKGRDEIKSMLDFMVEYVTSHFAEEEEYMDRYDFPESDEHKQQHRKLFEYVQDIYTELQQEGASVAVITAINHTMLNWLLRHVKQTDVKLGTFLAAQAA
ncbi:MAG: hemerythrin [Desulfuromonas sp.]|nr:MAG: hemerythrin [Desulfuromonas sp.]